MTPANAFQTWPPRRTDAPTLWERAKAMFASFATSIADRLTFTTRARRDFLARLAPVEKLVRLLMVVEAATYLLMTPEGRRLRAETPKIAPPAPPPPVGVNKPQHSTRILLPGWQTIAAYHPRIDPRVVERERHEALERRLAAYETLTQEIPDDPASLRCHFSILRWSHPDREPAKPQPPQRRSSLGRYSNTNFPLVEGMTLVTPQASSPNPLRTSDNLDLARRVEALSRILANPLPAVRRLARRLASLPADCIAAPDMAPVPTRHWHHGVLECWSATFLSDPACAILQRLAHEEPG